MQRPDPDQLLEKLQQDDARSQRGHLKIFFGACAGVGKTFAMLAAARARQAGGEDVVVGVVETHGRNETEQQIANLTCLPRRVLAYRGRELTEFDLDAALARRPDLLLVDELAHSNIEGSRHPKRWQDVQELLAAGIDVYTTLNVQHLESLNDVVGQITGIRVTETLPDHVFNTADEVTLVDLPPEELLRRLQEGKVYQGEQAAQAGRNFFRKGNLIALREMALRRTADRVDVQMREYRDDQAIQQVWQARERILLALGPGSEAEQLVRVAARLASSTKSDWLAVYVETPALQRLGEAQRDRIFKALRLAQELGAETATLAAAEVAPALLDYARSHNVSSMVVGKPHSGLLMRLFKPSVADQLGALAGDLVLHLVSHQTSVDKLANAPQHPATQLPARIAYQGYAWALLACIASSMLAALLTPYFELVNVVMLYMLAVILIASRFGRWPSVFSSFVSVALFDLFFVPPKLSFSVSDTQYLLTFMVMLTVALVISNLTSNLRYQALVATQRERRSRALYDLGKALAAALTASHIVEISSQHLSATFAARINLLLPGADEKLLMESGHHAAGSCSAGEVDAGIAQWVYDHQQQAGLGTYTLPSSAWLYLPLQAPMRTRGVLAIAPANPRQIFLPEQRQLLDAFASHIALAVERVHYVEVAQQALLSMESERLRNSLLSAISHDLRTPLTTIVGITEMLQHAPLPEAQRVTVQGLHEQVLRMHELVVNLLDMARLQSGQVQLKREWLMLEEVVGSALHICQSQLAGHHVEVSLPVDMPLLAFDAVLIERLLCNLLVNFSKYGGAHASVRISAMLRDHEAWISVTDDGPGLPAGMEQQIFSKFTRGEKESSQPGVGLGLSICQSIIQAHGGRIWATNRQPHGAEFTFSLPLGQPPEPLALEP